MAKTWLVLGIAEGEAGGSGTRFRMGRLVRPEEPVHIQSLLPPDSTTRVYGLRKAGINSLFLRKPDSVYLIDQLNPKYTAVRVTDEWLETGEIATGRRTEVIGHQFCDRPIESGGWYPIVHPTRIVIEDGRPWNIEDLKTADVTTDEGLRRQIDALDEIADRTIDEFRQREVEWGLDSQMDQLNTFFLDP